MNELTITRPDDWHVHLRDGEALSTTVKDISRYFGRAIVMPNLVPPVVSTEDAIAYKSRIMAQQPSAHFKPLMVLYLTNDTTPEEIRKAKESGVVFAAKLYPAGATTNSSSGVTDVKKIYHVLEEMEKVGLLLLIHGEVTDSAIDIFDREKAFIDSTLSQIVNDFPNLKIVLEHITTKDAVEFVSNTTANVAATITAHHLMYNRNHMLAGGIRPHFYCLPILKRNIHQAALVKAATSGSEKFFLGTDSAPHAVDKKEAACGCAGSYTAHAAIELYAEVFEQEGALDKLEAFASLNGPAFYGLQPNADKITLVRENWMVEEKLAFGQQMLVPIKGGESISWKVRS